MSSSARDRRRARRRPRRAARGAAARSRRRCAASRAAARAAAPRAARAASSRASLEGACAPPARVPRPTSGDCHCAHGILLAVSCSCATSRAPRTGRCGSAKPWLKPARVISDELEAGAGEQRARCRPSATAAPATPVRRDDVAARERSGDQRQRRERAAIRERRVRRGRALRLRRGRSPASWRDTRRHAIAARDRPATRRTAPSSDVVRRAEQRRRTAGTARRLRRARW